MSSEDEWEPVGPYVATVFSYAVHPVDSNTIYAGTFFNGVYKSSNGGLSWVHQDSGFGSAFVPAMVTDLNNPGTFYAGTFERGIFKKINTSNSWIPKNAGLDPLNINGLSISPINSARLLACSFLGPYATDNGGDQWNSWDKGSLYDIQLLKNVALSSVPSTGNTDRRLLLIASVSGTNELYLRFFDDLRSPNLFSQYIIPEADAAQLLATLNSFFWDKNLFNAADQYALVDDAIAATRHDVTLPCLSAIHSRTYESVAYLGTNGNGVYITEDSGNTWKPWNEGMEDLVVFDLKLHPDFEAVYAATNKGVFSRGSGDTEWKSLKYNLLDANITQINFLSDGCLVSSSGVGCFVLETVDDEIWDLWYTKPARLVMTIPGSTRVIVAGSVDTLDLSLDNGNTFRPVTQGIQNNFPDSLVAFQAGGETILAAGVDRGVWHTGSPGSDLPLDWVNASSISEHLILELTPHPGRDGHIYAGTERAGIWFSDDAAQTWAQRTDGIHPSHIYDIVQTSVGDNTYYCATKVGLYRSDDDGQYWRLATPDALPTLVTAVETDEVKPGFAYYGTTSGTLSFTQNNKDFFPFAQMGQSINAIRSVPYEGIYVVLDDGSVHSSRSDTLDLAPRNDGLNHPVLDLQVNLEETNIVYAGTAGGGVYKSVSEGSVWNQSDSGIENQFIFSLAIDPQDKNRIFTTSVGSVFLSEDAAGSWTQVSMAGLPEGIVITDIELDPFNQDILYCSALDHGVFKSIDGGITWSDTGLPGSDSRGPLPVAHSITQPGVILVGSETTGIQRRDATAGQWRHSGNGLTDLVRGIVISRNNPDLMYACSLSSGVFKSTDSGMTWVLSGLVDRTCLHMEINPHNDQEVFVGTTRGFAATFDGGKNWLEMGQRVAFASAISRSSIDPDSVIIGGSRGLLYETKNAGATWQTIAKGLPENEITVIRNAGDHGLFVGMDNAGVFRSLDGGQNWTLISGDILTSDRVTAIAIEAAYGQLFICTQTGGLYSSNLDGEFMAPQSLPRDNYAADNLTDAGIDPFNTDKLIVVRTNQSGEDISMHISYDRGSSWTTPESSSGLPPGSIFTMEPSPFTADEWLAGHVDGIYKSIDGGLEWTITTGGDVSVSSIVYSPDNPDRVYAAATNGGLLISSDRGNTWSWSSVDESLVVSGIAMGHVEGMVFASTLNRGMILSMDSGKTWTTGIAPELTTPVVLYVVINPANPKNIFLATTARGILRSYDGGGTFSSANNGLGENLSLLSILIDPQDPEVLYAGTITDGVYVSEDGGNSWTSMNDGKFHELTIALAIDPIDHRRIYAGFEGGGVYRIQRSPKYLRPESDVDGDGISAIWEQYLNLDPLADNGENSDWTSPYLEVGPAFRLGWLKGRFPPDEPVYVTVEWSRDMSIWSPLGSIPGPLPYGTIIEQGPVGDFIEMVAPVTDQEEGKDLFLRLVLTR